MNLLMNQVIYADCMNLENGLPTLEDKSIDLCLTDIPYNIKINPNAKKSDGSTTIDSKKVMYNDNIKNYEEFCRTLLEEIERICNGIIIYCGSLNLPMWCIIKKPRQIIYRYSRNSQSNGSMTWFIRVSPMVCYGKFKNRLKTDMFEYISYSGNHPKKNHNLIHPCPVNQDFWETLISQLNPSSVIDPFMGSGTTAEVCTKLDIPWIGYEINEVYSHDINLRLKNCKREPKQISIMDCVNR